MKVWRVLLSLEQEWRLFRFYVNIINWLIKRGVRLSSPLLCFLSSRLDKHVMSVTTWKSIYEKQTGKVVVFYKYNRS